MKRAAAMIFLSLALGFGGLYLVAGGALFDGDTYRFREISFWLVTVGGLALVAQWTTPGLKLMLLCRGQGVPLAYRPALLAHLVSVLGAAVTPSNTGGAPATVAALGRLGVPFGKGLGVTVQVVVLDLVFFSWSAPLGLFYLILTDTISLSAQAEILALAAVVLAVTASVVLSRSPRLVSWGILAVARWPVLRKFRDRLRGVARDYARSARAYRKMSGSDRIKLHVVTAAGWLSGYAVLWSLIGIYGVDTGFLTVLSLLGSITLVSNFVPTPGGSGFIEATVALSVGAGLGSVAAAVLLWRLTSFYLIFLLGPVAGWLLYFTYPRPASGEVPPPASEKHPGRHSA